MVGESGTNYGVNRFPSAEPQNLIYPYLSGRKTAAYAEAVNLAAVTTVGADLRHIPAKLARLANPDFPAHEAYRAACQRILGFVVTAIPSPNGQKAGIYVDATRTIPLEAMGEGVGNVVGLLVDLAVADGKLFLLEEPENDIHPSALKALLDLVVERSERNQFMVSTHSNIALRHLGGTAESTIHYVESETSRPPTASCHRVAPDPQARLAALADLGYELFDFDLWDGWLILEESSAERIIRDYLIPWFAPRLGRVRTVAAGGSSKTGPTFDDFNRLFRFTHLEAAYRGRAWVIVDGDAAGQAVVADLRQRYADSWPPESFDTWDQNNFEAYYPPRFQAAAASALDLPRAEKREAKRQLLEQVRIWADGAPQDARVEFEESAASVIGRLRSIESALFPDQ